MALYRCGTTNSSPSTNANTIKKLSTTGDSLTIPDLDITKKYAITILLKGGMNTGTPSMTLTGTGTIDINDSTIGTGGDGHEQVIGRFLICNPNSTEIKITASAGTSGYEGIFVYYGETAGIEE